MSSSEKPVINPGDMLRMTADVTAAYVSNNTLPATQLNDVIKTIYSSLLALDKPEGNSTLGQKPMVPIKKSVTPEYLICLEDGKKLKMLKRHLRTAYGITPEEYRMKWGLPADYPMVAPNYAEQRSEFAKKIGLGRKGAGKKKK
jgi:predicted transcriptional regulator